MRGRKERELELPVSSENSLGATIRAWRHFRGLTVTELAVRAGFGKNGRGYISKIEHHVIKRLSGESLTAIAGALDLSPGNLQQSKMPERQERQMPGKDTLDDAIVGCQAWLRIYSQDEKRLDYARTHFKLAELYWERMAHAEGKIERGMFLVDALHSINQALPLFSEEAPDSYEKAQSIRSAIERAIYLKDLDDAIAGCNALLKVYSQEKKALDWARTHTKLAQLYWDRTTQIETVDERTRLFVLALQSIDEALPIFYRHAPVSYTEAQRMRLDVAAAREKISL